jgi:hypothetical protein
MPGMAARVTDADGHVLEPISAWAELPEQYQLRVTRDRLGLDHVLVGDQEIVCRLRSLPGLTLMLMDRPSDRSSDLATNQTLDLKIDALRHELIASVDRRLRAQTWITTTTLIAGLALAFTAGRLG